jgi:uncharacterized protein
MQAVSNTSPILNLALIGRLQLLQEQFRDVSITEGVLEELRVRENLPGSKEILAALNGGWIQVVKLSDSAMLRVLGRDLDRGEAEAIALALETRADFVLLDERDARTIAKDLGLNVTGVLGILLHAWQQGKQISIEKEIECLKEKAGFRVSDALCRTILKLTKK